MAYSTTISLSDAFPNLVSSYKIENVKNTYGRVTLEKLCNFGVKLEAEACAPPWVFAMFFKLLKWCQIAQSVSC